MDGKQGSSLPSTKKDMRKPVPATRPTLNPSNVALPFCTSMRVVPPGSDIKVVGCNDGSGRGVENCECHGERG
eukprot:1252491-Rhodomonas_salina.1